MVTWFSFSKLPISDCNLCIIIGPEKEVQFVVVGEKARAIMFRDSKNDIVLSVTELNKNPLNYAQVGYLLIVRSITSSPQSIRSRAMYYYL